MGGLGLGVFYLVGHVDCADAVRGHQVVVAIPPKLSIQEIEVTLHQPKRPKIVVTKDNILPIVLPQPLHNPAPEEEPVNIHGGDRILNIVDITAILDVELHADVAETGAEIPSAGEQARGGEGHGVELLYQLGVVVGGGLQGVDWGCVREARAVVAVGYDQRQRHQTVQF